MCNLSPSLLLPTRLKPGYYSDKRSNSSKATHSLSPIEDPRGKPIHCSHGKIFESSKLKVIFVGVDEKKHPPTLPRTYTLTHSDITAKLTLAISHLINNSQLQGWANRIYRDEVVESSFGLVGFGRRKRIESSSDLDPESLWETTD